MLTHLTIKNYALIDHLEMDLSRHLNVITGETGAGKSIMLGAIGLLLGNRADTKVLWNDKEKCITEGTFDIGAYHLQPLFESENLDYDKQTVIRREISPGGKSRAFINDTPVTLDIMKKIGMRLMDIHSQHETLDLGNRAFQLSVIDAFAANGESREKYKSAWQHYVITKEAFDALSHEANILRQESDFVKFQLEELSKARLVEGEQEALESALKIMEHAEDIKTKFNQLLVQLDRSDISASGILNEARTTLSALSNYSDHYKKLTERFESVRIELSDIISEIEGEEEKIDLDPEKIEEAKNRLSLIYQLQQKHRLGSVKELLQLQSDLQLKADKTSNLDEELASLKKKLEQGIQRLNEKGEALSQSRLKSFKGFCKQMVNLLSELGIPEAQLIVEHQTGPPTASGSDNIELLFSANKGIAVRPLAQVASGGEFSRLMFCIKYLLAEKTSLPTLILDEIDTGVSGEIAIRLGKMMKTMAEAHQLLAISHLPQIAAKADCHFYAYKDSKRAKTISQIKRLTEEERIEEIAKMIGGEKPSTLAKENARELIMG
ncbi:MAG: DNA repair protein RecN [Cyclobacteriaceae bacterium]|nr:DNA repair protein RecN [Cyclobacteriaceae bacterium]